MDEWFKMIKKLLLVFLGTGIGSLIRVEITTISNNSQENFLYYVTLLITNILASILAIIVFETVKQETFKLFLISGILGGLSTFSSIFVFPQKEDFTFFTLYPAFTFFIGFCISFGVFKIIRSKK